jgi:hypothetical protein
MRSTSPCAIALMSMFCPSFVSTEVLMVVYAALVVLMPRCVFISSYFACQSMIQVHVSIAKFQ